MPIIISRNGPVEPKETNPLTPAQKQALWEHIVMSWCAQNPEKLEAVARETKEGAAC